MKTNGRRTLGQLGPVETLPAICMVPLVMGPSPLVGIGCTLGVYPNCVRVWRPQTREFGANATGTLPFLCIFLDRVAEMVERLGNLRPELVAHSF